MYIFESMDDGTVHGQGQDRGGETAWYMGERQGLLYILLSPPPAPYSRKTGYILGAKGKAHIDNRTGHTHTEWLIGGQVYGTIRGKSRNHLLSKTGHVWRQGQGTCGGARSRHVWEKGTCEGKGQACVW